MDVKTLNNIFIQSTAHVLQVMAQCEATAGKPYIKKDHLALEDYTAYICANCTSSENKGNIGMSFSGAGAQCVAKTMLGEDIDDEQSLKEVVGEIVNIVSGDARRRMAAAGVVFDGSTPKMLHGAGNAIPYDSKAPVVVIPFKLPQGQFVIEFSFEL